MGSTSPSRVAPSSDHQQLDQDHQQQQQQRQLAIVSRPLLDKNSSDSEKGAAIGVFILAFVAKHGRDVPSAHVLEELKNHPELAWFIPIASLTPNILLLLIKLTNIHLHLFDSCDVSRFHDLSDSQLLGISSTFSNCLRVRKTAPAGYDQWRGKYAAIQDLSTQHPFLKHAIIPIGQQVILVSPWGAAFRIYSGAVISFLDMISDIVMIEDYLTNDLFWSAAYLLICIALNLAIQIIIIIAQNQKLGKIRVVKEVTYLVLCIKPAVDAARVVRGKPQEKGTLVAPLTEMLFSKTSEVVSEAIPASILQVFIVLSTGKVSAKPILSIMLSFASIALTSTSMAFDADCFPESRSVDPEFFVSTVK
jgi:hypothetical protein